ncbi:MAG: Hpt domain-containing protein [Oscillospiraceae bacterium]|jgi:HPt (histidine-containing phosphotransfer) domain-containing protein|nr:Hpt domain-containing protein [Oscillospiraceae bacterium]
MNVLAYINEEEGITRLAGNKDFYYKLLRKVVDSKEISGLKQAIKEKDAVKAAEFAHAIKGVSGNLSLTLLFQQSGILTEALRKGIIDREMCRKFFHCYDKTVSAVKELVSD